MTNPIPASPTTERWALPSSDDHGSITSAFTKTFEYYHQFQVTFQYSIANSPGTPTDPTATYIQFGASGTTTTAKQSSPPSDWVDAGSSVTYTNPINGGVGERWKIAPDNSASPYVADASVAATETLNPSYYHQFQVSASYSTSDGSTPSDPVVLSGTQFGSSSFTLTLTTTAQTPWLDAGTSWSVNNPIPSLPVNERWYDPTAADTSGTVTGAITIATAYHHQYLVQFSVSPSLAGTTTPSASTWYDAGSSGNPISASANAGYTFGTWAVTCVSGSSCLTIASPTSSSTTFSVSGPGTITADFTIDTAITYSGATSGEYSDPVALSATLKDYFGNALVSYSLTFTIGSQSVSATTGAGGVASTTLVLNQAKGSYSVVVNFAGDFTYTASSSTTPFTINPEPATIVYTGTTSVLTTSPPTSITLSAQVTSELDDTPGSITLAKVTFQIYQVSASTPFYTSSPLAVTQTSPGVGIVSTTIPCSTLPGGCTNEDTYLVYGGIGPSPEQLLHCPRFVQHVGGIHAKRAVRDTRGMGH